MRGAGSLRDLLAVVERRRARDAEFREERFAELFLNDFAMIE